MASPIPTGALRIPTPTSCPTSIGGLLDILRRAEVTFPGATGMLVNFGADIPSEDYRDMPWIKTDGDRNPLGIFTYSATKGKWVRDFGVPRGGILTVMRGEDTLQADRESKGLTDGWELADGTGITGLDLRDTNETQTISVGTASASISLPKLRGFFKGTAPEYEVYTLVFIGY